MNQLPQNIKIHFTLAIISYQMLFLIILQSLLIRALLLMIVLVLLSTRLSSFYNLNPLI